MRYATITLRWTDERAPPTATVFADADAVTIDALRHASPGPEGEHVELIELRGDLDQARSVLAGAPEVLDYDITGAGEPSADRGVAYIRWRTAGLVADLLAALHDNEIAVDWPVYPLRVDREGESDGEGARVGDGSRDRGVTVTVYGTTEAIQRAVADVPDGVRIEIERIGEYEPETGRFAGTLTERQRELFELAVREGYYEIPRETTHRELADRLDLAPGTVSEHLQRIEAKLVAAVADGSP